MPETFTVDNNELLRRICGTHDSNIKLIESMTDATIVPRGNSLVIRSSNPKESDMLSLFHELSDLLEP